MALQSGLWLGASPCPPCTPLSLLPTSLPSGLTCGPAVWTVARSLTLPTLHNTLPPPHLPALRFDVWPYLERFTVDVEREVLAEMGGKPDLVIGNYR